MVCVNFEYSQDKGKTVIFVTKFVLLRCTIVPCQEGLARENSSAMGKLVLMLCKSL